MLRLRRTVPICHKVVTPTTEDHKSYEKLEHLHSRFPKVTYTQKGPGKERFYLLSLIFKNISKS